MEVVLGVSFGYEPNDELRKLLEDFRDMVNFCIDYEEVYRCLEGGEA